MIDLGPRTNIGVALFKLLHQREESPIVYDDFIHWYLPDDQHRQIQQLPPMPLAPPSESTGHFIWHAYWYTILRERYIDDWLVESVNKGCTQVLNLGAGFDTRYFRMLELFGSSVDMFEVDRNKTIAEKTAAIEAHRGSVPDRLHLVSMDLATHRIADLESVGIDLRIPTAVILQGVVYYLPPDSAVSLLESVATAFSSGCRLAYDGCHPTMLTESDSVPGIGAQIAKLKEIGEPYLFGEHPASARERLLLLGCSDVAVLEMSDLASKYQRQIRLPDVMWYVVSAEITPGGG